RVVFGGPTREAVGYFEAVLGDVIRDERARGVSPRDDARGHDHDHGHGHDHGHVCDHAAAIAGLGLQIPI
ncbi:MAG: hypothetical protein WCG85_04020, partial [Polyangia bacterium]